MEKGKKYVIANWKMNPETIGEAKELFFSIKPIASRLSNVQTVLCPPAPFLDELYNTYTGRSIAFGVQNVHSETKGAFTGEVSAKMAGSVGAAYVIVGHSERREIGETNDMVRGKVAAVLQEKLVAILCIGERERDHRGDYLSFLREELLSALDGIPQTLLKRLLITYEPIWAIGKTGKDAMEPQELYETVLFLRKLIAETYDKKTALSLPILYGGSVESDNCRALLEAGGVCGFLVGRASLSVPEFGVILQTANTVR